MHMWVVKSLKSLKYTLNILMFLKKLYIFFKLSNENYIIFSGIEVDQSNPLEIMGTTYLINKN